MASGNRAHLQGLAQQLLGNKTVTLSSGPNKRLDSQAFANRMAQQPRLRSKEVISVTSRNFSFAMVNIGLSPKMCDSVGPFLRRFLT